MSQDIRRWFAKKPEKGAGNGNASILNPQKPPVSQPGKMEQGIHECSARRKTSKYFVTDKNCVNNESEVVEASSRGTSDLVGDKKPLPQKRLRTIEDEGITTPVSRKAPSDMHPKNKLESPGKGVSHDVADDDDEEDAAEQEKPSSKLVGRGRGRGSVGKGSSVLRSGGKEMFADKSNEDDEDTKSINPGGRGRGRGTPMGGRSRGGGGRSGFMNFGERKDPPHKGEKEIPEGSPNCLDGLTFVISGTLDSLEREEAEDLIKRHGGRVTGSVSKKTNYLLCDEDIGGRKSAKAKELGTKVLTEDGLFEMIQSSNKSKASAQNSTKLVEHIVKTSPKNTPQAPGKPSSNSRGLASCTVSQQNNQPANPILLPWTEKYRPKVPNDIVGNQSLVKQLHDWLKNWDKQILNTEKKEKGRKQSDSGLKKAVLLSGTPGIGKTSAAKLVTRMLGFHAIEVNASDSRGKADSKINKGIGGSTSNLVKELVNNEALSLKIERSQHPKAVLIMDEVDGMSAGDRGGIADLISSIKISKIPIICICNDRYSQKIKSLVNYCLPLNFRKPTKQQIAKRLSQIASAEGLQVNEIALEELSEKVNGDIRLALNQLQYMSLSMSLIKFDDIKQRLQRNAKDEDISPFTAVDKLFGFHGGKLQMDERVGLSMSDPDLVPLLIQENYINYRPSAAVKDDNGVKRIQLVAMAAESIGDGDIVNVQIRRYQRWQLSQIGSLTSCIIPAALLHGQRETFEQGERNFNRFGGWLGKNSTMGKNYRLLEDLHVHLLASRESNLGRATLRLDYLTLLLKQLTDPLRVLAKDEAVGKVIEFMDLYSISMEDLDNVVELSKFKGYPDPLAGIQPAVKAALTRAYNKGSTSRVIRAADLVALPGSKKALKKRVITMLEPSADSENPLNEDMENEDENTSETEEQEDDSSDSEKNQLQSDLQKLNSKGIKVEMDLKGSDSKKTPSGRGKRNAPATSEAKPKAPKTAAKRKRVT